jgi:hypothetical protein
VNSSGFLDQAGPVAVVMVVVREVVVRVVVQVVVRVVGPKPPKEQLSNSGLQHLK